jgi:hypothetical protein
VKTDRVSVPAMSHHRSGAVVTVCDLGLGVISTPSLPQRCHSVATALSQSRQTCHDAASLPMQQHLAPLCGMTPFLSSENWVAVAMPIYFETHATAPQMMPAYEANAGVAVGEPR